MIPEAIIQIYSALTFIGSRIIESAAYCTQKLLVHLYLNSTQNPSVSLVIVITFMLTQSDFIKRGHCNRKSIKLKRSQNCKKICFFYFDIFNNFRFVKQVWIFLQLMFVFLHKYLTSRFDLVKNSMNFNLNEIQNNIV